MRKTIKYKAKCKIKTDQKKRSNSKGIMFRGRVKSCKLERGKVAVTFSYSETVRGVDNKKEYGVGIDTKSERNSILLDEDEEFELSYDLYRFLCSCRDEELLIEFCENKITKITVI